MGVIKKFPLRRLEKCCFNATRRLLSRVLFIAAHHKHHDPPQIMLHTSIAVTARVIKEGEFKVDKKRECCKVAPKKGHSYSLE